MAKSRQPPRDSKAIRSRVARRIRWSWIFLLVEVTREPKITDTWLWGVLGSFVDCISECFLNRIKLLVVF